MILVRRLHEKNFWAEADAGKDLQDVINDASARVAADARVVAGYEVIEVTVTAKYEVQAEQKVVEAKVVQMELDVEVDPK